MRILTSLFVFLTLAIPAVAQSPNTSTVVVLVTDQSGAAIADASVAVTSDSRLSIRGGYGMYYTQLIGNVLAGYLVNGLDGLTTYTATPGQFGFPGCLTALSAAVLRSENAAALAVAGSRYHDPRGYGRQLSSAVREVRPELRSAPELSRQAREPAQSGDVHRR